MGSSIGQTASPSIHLHFGAASDDLFGCRFGEQGGAVASNVEGGTFFAFLGVIGSGALISWLTFLAHRFWSGNPSSTQSLSSSDPPSRPLSGTDILTTICCEGICSE